MSLIVVTFNNEKIIERCLNAVQKSVAEHSARLMVVDNASTDDTLRRIEATAPEAMIIPLRHNLGFAAANNVALRQAQGRYVVLINSDAFPDAGAVDHLVRRADSNSRIGLVGGRLRNAAGRPQPSTGAFPSLLRNLGVAVLLHRLPLSSRLPLTVSASPRHYRKAHRVDWVSGAFCLARRDVGDLPEAGFMYGEDVEWARQAHERGLEVWLEPLACATHLGGGGASSASAGAFRQNSRVTFELRWFETRGPRTVAVARAVIAIHALIRIGLYAMMLPARRDAARDGIAEFGALFRAALRQHSPYA
ncbi:MAG: putative glycosyltransferase [Mycobacterium sp.]|nr:putative glycosyltransferase [Mycobacterium sp.]